MNDCGGGGAGKSVKDEAGGARDVGDWVKDCAVDLCRCLVIVSLVWLFRSR